MIVPRALCLGILLVGSTSFDALADDRRTWRRRSGPEPRRPDAREDHTLVYAGGGTTLVIGGQAYYTDQEAWSWNGAAWTEIDAQALFPHWYTYRAWAAASYDSVRDLVVYFGGWDGDGVTNETWEWSRTAAHWGLRASGALAPRARMHHALAFDAERGVCVLHGGMAVATAYSWELLDDVWEWNGLGGVWTSRTFSGPSPGPRMSHAMAWDPLRRSTLLFGGTSLGMAPTRDLWEWNGAWTRVDVSGEQPPLRVEHAMTTDAVRGRILVHGGWPPDTDDAEPYADLWEWNGSDSAWRDVTPADFPSARAGSPMAFDPSRGRVVLFGGRLSDNHQSPHLLEDTWEWDSASGQWVEVLPAPLMPSGRSGAALVYDSQRGRVVLFGGHWAHDDTWEWNGESLRWTHVTTQGDRPPGRSGHAMAYDAARGRVVLFGGGNYWDGNWFPERNTWEWDGASHAWSSRLPSLSPSAREGHAMAFDPFRGRTLVHGGYADNGSAAPTFFDDLWEWDGTAWSRVETPSPRPVGRTRHAAAYEAPRNVWWMFGGWMRSSELFDLWEWNVRDGTWVERSQGNARPSAQGSAVYQLHDDAVLFFADRANGLHETWTWRADSGWAQLGIPSPLPPRIGPALVYDGMLGGALVFGGFVSPQDDPRGYLRDTWTLTAPNRPPWLDPIGPQSVPERQRLSFDVQAGDPDGTNPVLSARGLPQGASFDPRTGRFDWTPGCVAAGEYPVLFTASDGELEASEQVPITVTVANCPPTISPIEDAVVVASASYSAVVHVSDPDLDDMLDVSWDLPDGAVVEPIPSILCCAFEVRWTPIASQVGTHTAAVMVSDSIEQVRESFTLTVVLGVEAPPAAHTPRRPAVPVSGCGGCAEAGQGALAVLSAGLATLLRANRTRPGS